MTLHEIIHDARLRLEDTITPYLWSDEELMDFANEAVREACRRSEILKDSQTAACSLLILQSGVKVYPLHPSVLRVESAYLASTSKVLTQITRLDVNKWYATWRNPEHIGVPLAFVVGDSDITVLPVPNAADSLYLEVVRLPLVDMVTMNDSPEIPLQYQDGLIDWMCYQAYSKQDSETSNPQVAMNYRTLFDNSFGVRPNANRAHIKKTIPSNLRMFSSGLGT